MILENANSRCKMGSIGNCLFMWLDLLNIQTWVKHQKKERGSKPGTVFAINAIRSRGSVRWSQFYLWSFFRWRIDLTKLITTYVPVNISAYFRTVIILIRNITARPFEESWIIFDDMVPPSYFSHGNYLI